MNLIELHFLLNGVALTLALLAVAAIVAASYAHPMLWGTLNRLVMVLGSLAMLAFFVGFGCLLAARA